MNFIIAFLLPLIIKSAEEFELEDFPGLCTVTIDGDDGRERILRAHCGIGETGTFFWDEPHGQVELQIRNTGACFDDAGCTGSQCCTPGSTNNCGSFEIEKVVGNVQFLDVQNRLLNIQEQILDVSKLGTLGVNMMSNIKVRSTSIGEAETPIKFNFSLVKKPCPRPQRVLV